MLATLANMLTMAGHPGVFAYSPTTGERCSADPGDYWYCKPGDCLRDSKGQEMFLVVRRIDFTPVKGSKWGPAPRQGDLFDAEA